jgi:hypothetical protein
MTAPPLAASNAMLAAGPSALQAALVLLLVCLVAAREAVRLRDPLAPAARRLSQAVNVLAPAALTLLAVRFLVILQ